MTNGEKFKTAQERSEAFDKFCKSNTTDGGMCMPDCKLFYAQDDSKDYCGHCEFYWLDLEAEEEKPLPCPFCGNDNLTIEKDYYGSQVNCLYCGYRSIKCGVNVNPIAAHNRVAKKCREVKA